MMALNQMACLPSFFNIGTDLIDNAGALLKKNGIDVPSVVLASGPIYSWKVAERISSSLPPHIKATHFVIREASERAVSELHAFCRASGAELVLSIGGGSVVDVGKRLHRLFNVPNIVIPTVISNDGLISPISVLKGDDGARDSYPASVPVGALIDISIIKAAPECYLLAAAGDLLSNLSASQDWVRLNRAGDPSVRFNDLAYHLAFGTAETVINSSIVDFRNDCFIEGLVRCQIYSGLAMSLAGSSRPCSGAEHLISHAIDQSKLVSGVLHGCQVGTISLFTLHLLDWPMEAALRFARRIGLVLDWRRLGRRLPSHVPEVIALARRVRVGRRTILDEYTDQQLVRECDLFAHKWSRKPQVAAAQAC